MRLYVKENTGYILLDLMEDNPIKLTMAVSDIMDPTKSPSTYSQTFRVPNTANNNLFFKSAFNINAQTFDATKKIDAYIEDSNVTISVGNIRLTNIFTNNKDKNVEYEVTFFGEVSDFAAKIGGGFMNSLSLSQYNHEKSYVNIVNSWNGNLFGGDVIYPLIEWGYDYLNGEPVQNTLSYRDGTHSKKGFTANNHPLSIDQFKPVIRAKVLLDAIFAGSGYTYESDFLSGSDFMNQYVITEQVDSATDTTISKMQASGLWQQVLYSDYQVIQLPNEVLDPLRALTNNVFKVPIQFTDPLDYYIFTIQGWYTAHYTVNQSFDVEIYNVTTNTVIGTTTFTAPSLGLPYYFSTTINIFNTSASLGDELVFRIFHLFVPGGSPQNNISEVQVLQSTSQGNIAVLNKYLPTNIKTIDFLKGIIERYNLVLEPSKSKEKHFIITPWVDWVEQGAQRDWTEYVDGNVDIVSSPLFTSQPRSNTWRDDEDSDFVNYNFQTATKTTYGQLDLDSNIEVITGNEVTQSLFAPTPLLPIGNSSAETSAHPNQKLAAKFLIPHIAKDTTTERTPITPKLRLVYYNGMRNAPLEWHVKNDALVTQHWNQYPLVSQYSALDTTTIFRDLAWRNAAPLWDITPSVPNPPARTSSDLWNNFWRKWYEFTYDKYGRIVEMDIVLDYKKVWDLKFNDKIFIKDAWYMVNKITDYQVGKPTACKVELIRVGESISIVPRQLIEGQLMCYISNPETICDVYCCFENGGANVLYYESNGQIFLDPNGNFPAPSGVYSYGASNTFSVINGIITTYHVTTSCVCVPNVIRYYQPCRGNSVYEAGCCQFPLQPFYAYSNTVYQATQAWSDAALTIPVADGWYANPGELFVAQFINGIKVQVAARITCIP
jgi:serine/threonine protein kinase